MLKGGCLCAGVRHEIVGPVGSALYCHCSMRRKFHGSAFRARLTVPKSSFRFVRGEALLTEYRSSSDTIKRFCRVCGSAINNSWYPQPDAYGLAMGSLDDDPGVRPTCHILSAPRRLGTTSRMACRSMRNFRRLETTPRP